MMTKKELHDEFWLLTKSVLEDSKIDADEVRVIKRWLKEHWEGYSFEFIIEKLNGFLSDGYVDRIESQKIMVVLRDDGMIFDITDADARVSSLRSYLVSELMTAIPSRRNLTTTGFNRNVFKL